MKKCIAFMLFAVVIVNSGCTLIKFDTKNIETKAVGIGDHSIQMDLVGVNTNNYDEWAEMSMTDYWDSQLRKDAIASGYVHEILFQEGNPTKVIISKENNSQLWEQWSKQKAKHLFILADLSGCDDKDGSADPRRSILKMKCCTITNKTIEVTLNVSGIRIITPTD